jgi:hypothetical protein
MCHFSSRYGYGGSTNVILRSAALEDLFQTFQEAISKTTRIFMGYFTHDSLITMIYTALGLYRDEEELSGSKRNPDRKWRTSSMTPFAANFIAVLHKYTYIPYIHTYIA